MTVQPPDVLVEDGWCAEGAPLVAGMDEEGRGALAGVVDVDEAAVRVAIEEQTVEAKRQLMDSL